MSETWHFQCAKGHYVMTSREKWFTTCPAWVTDAGRPYHPGFSPGEHQVCGAPMVTGAFSFFDADD